MAEQTETVKQEAAAPAAAPAPAPAAAPKAAAPVEEVSRPAPNLPEGAKFIWGVGRRKTSVARVRIRPGVGSFMVNKREATDYFRYEKDREDIFLPLRISKMLKSWDIFVNVRGGGYTGQAGAVSLGLSRALIKALPDPDMETALRDEGLLTRDARMVERKKPGQPGARRRFQFSKR